MICCQKENQIRRDWFDRLLIQTKGTNRRLLEILMQSQQAIIKLGLPFLRGAYGSGYSRAMAVLDYDIPINTARPTSVDDLINKNRSTNSVYSRGEVLGLREPEGRMFSSHCANMHKRQFHVDSAVGLRHIADI